MQIYPTWTPRQRRVADRFGGMGNVDPLRMFVIHAINERTLLSAARVGTFAERHETERQIAIARRKMAHWERLVENYNDIVSVMTIIKRGNANVNGLAA